MRALAFQGIGRVGQVEREVPSAGPGDAVVRSTASLICTSDVHTVAVGSQVTFAGCLRSTKVGGTISNLGYHGESGPTLTIPLDAFGLGMADKRITTHSAPVGASAGSG